MKLSKTIKRVFFYGSPILILLYYYYINPTDEKSLSLSCTFKQYTSLSCTGCGTQRALHNLLHGNINEAVQNNVLFVLGWPFLFFLYYQIVETYIIKSVNKYSGIIFSSKTGMIVLVISILFLIIRNLPFLRDILSA